MRIHLRCIICKHTWIFLCAGNDHSLQFCPNSTYKCKHQSEKKKLKPERQTMMEKGKSLLAGRLKQRPNKIMQHRTKESDSHNFKFTEKNYFLIVG